MKKPDFVDNIISTFFLRERERKKEAKLSQLSRNVQDPRSLNPPLPGEMMGQLIISHKNE